MKPFLQVILLAALLCHGLLASAKSLPHDKHAIPVTIQNYNIQGPVKLTHGNTTLETEDYKVPIQPQTYVSYPDAHHYAPLPHNGPAYVITAYQAELRHPVPLHPAHTSPTAAVHGAQKQYFIPPLFNHHYQAPVYNAPVVYQQQGSDFPQRITTHPHVGSHQFPVYPAQQGAPVIIQNSGHQSAADSAALRTDQVNQAVTIVEAHQSPSQQAVSADTALDEDAGKEEMMAVLFELERPDHKEATQFDVKEAAVQVNNEQDVAAISPEEPTPQSADGEQVNINESEQDAQQQLVQMAEKVPAVPLDDEIAEPLSIPKASADSEIVQIKDSLSAEAIARQVVPVIQAEKTEQSGGYNAEPVAEQSAAQSEPELFALSDDIPEVTTQAAQVEPELIEQFTTTQPEIEVFATTSPTIDDAEYQTEAVNIAAVEPTIGELLAVIESVPERVDSATEANDDSTVYVVPEQHLDAVPEQSTEPSQEEAAVTEQQLTTYAAAPVAATNAVSDVSENGEISQSSEKLAIVPLIYRNEAEDENKPTGQLEVIPPIFRNDAKKEKLVVSEIIPLIFRKEAEEEKPEAQLKITPLIYRSAEEAPKAVVEKAEEPVAADQITQEASFQTAEVPPVLVKCEETTVYSSTAEPSTIAVSVESSSHHKAITKQPEQPEALENEARYPPTEALAKVEETTVSSSSVEPPTAAVPVVETTLHESASPEQSETLESSTTVYSSATEQPAKDDETMTEEAAVEQKTEVTPIKLTTTRAPRPYSTTKRRQYTTTTSTTTTTTPLPPVRTKPDYHRFRKPVHQAPKVVVEVPLLPSFTDSAASHEMLESAEPVASQESVEEGQPKYPANLRNRTPAKEKQVFKIERPYPIVTKRPLASSEIREISGIPSRVAKKFSSTSYNLRTSRTGLQFPKRTEKLFDAQPNRAPSDFTRGVQREQVADSEKPNDHVAAGSNNKVQKVSQMTSEPVALDVSDEEFASGEYEQDFQPSASSTWTFHKIKKALDEGEEHYLPSDVVVDRENSRIILPEGFTLYYLADSEVPSIRRP